MTNEVNYIVIEGMKIPLPMIRKLKALVEFHKCNLSLVDLKRSLFMIQNATFSMKTEELLLPIEQLRDLSAAFYIAYLFYDDIEQIMKEMEVSMEIN